MLVKRTIIVILLCIIFMILDNALVPLFSIRGYYPSLLFLFCLCYSMINGIGEGIWVGVFSGALQDIYLFNGFGINMLINMFMCIIAAVIGNSIFKEKSLIPVATSFMLNMLKGVLVFCILYLVKQYTRIEDVFLNSIYAMVVSIFMYRWVYKLCNKEYMVKKWKF